MQNFNSSSKITNGSDGGSVEVNRIKQLLIKVGDDGSESFKKDIQKVVEQLTEYYLQNKLEIRDAIVHYMQEGIYAINLLPLKAGIYAAIVALLSVKQATNGLSELIIQAILDQLQTISQEANPIIGKNIMCFLGELMNVGLLTSVNFVEGLYDLEGGAESEISPFCLQILLCTLPHTMIKSMEKNQIEFKNILNNIENLMQKRNRYANQNDELDLLWNAIRTFNSSSQNISSEDQQQFIKKSYPRPAFLFPDEMNLVKQIRKNFKIHISKRTLSWIPQAIYVGQNDYKRDDSKATLMQEILRQWVLDTLFLFKSNKHMLVLQFEFYQKSLNLQPVQEANFKKVSVYTLLNQLIDSTPHPNAMPSIFFSSLMVSLVQRENKPDWVDHIEQFVDQCITIYPCNIYVIDQLTDFLSHFWSSSNLKCNWDKYTSITEQLTDGKEQTFGKHYFVFEFLRKLFSLISIDKVKDQIPKELISWYQNCADPKVIKQVDLNPLEQERVDQVNSFLSSKLPAEEMIQKLSQLGGEDKKEEMFKIFTECLLKRMQASITHLIVLSKRYRALLVSSEFIDRESLQQIILETLFNLWGHSIFHLKVYIQEFLNMGVLNITTSVEWVLSRTSKRFDFYKFEETQSLVNLLLTLSSVFRQVIVNLKNKANEEFIKTSFKKDELCNILQILNSALKTKEEQIVIHILNLLETYVAVITQQLGLDIGQLLNSYFDGGNNVKKEDLKLISSSWQKVE